jgi:3,4-dihydroxy 2-butanone 4-phosphate synthase/GTP cyclohydrolase II
MSIKKLERVIETRIPNSFGEFELIYYNDIEKTESPLALVFGKVSGKHEVLTRIHSECFTGEVLGSLRCDCGNQLLESLRLISEADEGILIYLRQEGRGIGLLEKLKAYQLQDEGYDTVDANIALGHEPDEREYTSAALILEDLNVNSVRLLTNNPLKVASLERLGVPVVGKEALNPKVTPENISYLRTKALRMGHDFNLDILEN